PDLADGNALQLAPRAVSKVDEGSHTDDGGEHGRQDADDVHNREAAYGPRAERQQRDTHNKGREVRVENGAPCAFETQIDRLLRRMARAQLFAYAFVDQHVCVALHAPW